MNRASKAGNRVSVLALGFEILDDRPDWPVVTIRVDGEDPFKGVAESWRGFDPGEILGPSSPLLPDDNGRRVAVYRCSCGEPGCGVIAPVITSSASRGRVSWIDFRDYGGVFDGPTTGDPEEFDGKPWNLPDIHFDRDQYLAEVERVGNDRTWETPRRQTCRLLHEHLKPMDLVLPPDHTLRWISPAWAEEGVSLMFEQVTHEPYGIKQRMLHLTSARSDPAKAAKDMAEQLLSVDPEDWTRTFGHRY